MLLSVSERTVRRLAKRGELRAVRVGGSVRFHRTELEALVGNPQSKWLERQQPGQEGGLSVSTPPDDPVATPASLEERLTVLEESGALAFLEKNAGRVDRQNS